MIIYALSYNHNGIYIDASQQEPFWMFINPVVGWGKFEMLRESSEFIENGGLFQLTEVRPADQQPPYPLFSDLGVLWRRQEAIAAEKSIQSFAQGELSPELAELRRTMFSDTPPDSRGYC